MEVILLEKIERLGALGQVVRVKDGFARNFLLPMGKALRATKDNLAFFEREKAALEAANAKRRDAAGLDAKKLDGLHVVIIRQAAEGGHLYGSVSARDIAEEAATLAGIAIPRSSVVLNTPIKTLGLFEVPVALHAEVRVKVSVNIARSAEEAAVQKKTGKAVVKNDHADDAPVATAEQEAA